MTVLPHRKQTEISPKVPRENQCQAIMSLADPHHHHCDISIASGADLKVQASGVLMQDRQWCLVLSTRKGTIDVDQVLAARIHAKWVGFRLGLISLWVCQHWRASADVQSIHARRALHVQEWQRQRSGLCLQGSTPTLCCCLALEMDTCREVSCNPDMHCSEHASTLSPGGSQQLPMLHPQLPAGRSSGAVGATGD